jgi:hypothetical protein
VAQRRAHPVWRDFSGRLFSGVSLETLKPSPLSARQA